MYMTLEDRFRFLFGIILIAALFSGSTLIMLEINNKYWNITPHIQLTLVIKYIILKLKEYQKHPMLKLLYLLMD